MYTIAFHLVLLWDPWTCKWVSRSLVLVPSLRALIRLLVRLVQLQDGGFHFILLYCFTVTLHSLLKCIANFYYWKHVGFWHSDMDTLQKDVTIYSDTPDTLLLEKHADCFPPMAQRKMITDTACRAIRKLVTFIGHWQWQLPWTVSLHEQRRHYWYLSSHANVSAGE